MTTAFRNSARPRFSSVRRGVTLLEVLVAMGVMIVGLLGMAALIPLGRMELVEAEKLDNASTVGRWAFRDVTIRGYLQPENWIDPANGEPVFGPGGGGYDLVSGSIAPMRSFKIKGAPNATVPPYAPIVIDPLMIAPRKLSTANDQKQREICGLFPYSLNLPGATAGMPELAGLVPKIARVSLRAFPSDITALPAARTKLIMNSDVASRFFRSTDDLNFQVPQDTTRRPIQIYSQTSSSDTSFYTNDGYTTETQLTSSVAARQFTGAYSWFLVAEPSLAEFYSSAPNAPAMGGPNASAVGIRQFRVWVVVCHQRILNPVAEQSFTDPQGISERLVYVDFIDRNTARIRVNGITDEAAAANALNVKANQWIAVVGRYKEPLLGDDNRYVMEWYRVSGAAERPTLLPDSQSQWYREVTLVGREFSGLGFSFLDEDTDTTYPDLATTLAGNTGDVPLMTGWGIIVSGVRGVYEKSIYLDRPSIYSVRY
ncbi:MAG: hypothetical protein K8U03_07490 [Planctomycetia bacterium]|nr:hypothetical protein [Planctomycetia bacterium]